jgi:hypothetical protein
MTKADPPGRASYQLLSTKAIRAGALVPAVVGAGSVWLLLTTFGHDRGGAAALLLTGRRQWFVE